MYLCIQNRYVCSWPPTLKKKPTNQKWLYSFLPGVILTSDFICYLTPHLYTGITLGDEIDMLQHIVLLSTFEAHHDPSKCSNMPCGILDATKKVPLTSTFTFHPFLHSFFITCKRIKFLTGSYIQEAKHSVEIAFLLIERSICAVQLYGKPGLS